MWDKKTLMIVFILTACVKPNKQVVVVQVAGELQQIMHHGDIGAKATLDSLSIPGIYGLGALDSLKGEILIEDGTVLVSRVTHGAVSVNTASAEAATLLVFSEVHDWQEFTTTGNELEQLLVEAGRKQHLQAPFPYMLKGSFSELDYHVINFKGEANDMTNHQEHAFQGSLAGKEVVILGFYSTRHQGIFTHHDSNTHMHVRDTKNKEMGHIDHLKIGDQSFTLLLPKL